MDTINKLDIFYWGEFSVKKLLKLKDWPLLHIYGPSKWPVHQFIGTIPYSEISFLSQHYKRALIIDESEEFERELLLLGLEVLNA